MTKFFKFIATIQIEADNQKNANDILDKIKNDGEFPDGSIIDNNFNVKTWEQKLNQKIFDPTKGTYPEIKTTHNWYRHFKGTGYKEFDDFDKASKFLNEHRDWQIYTEIEGDIGTTYYDRGFHVCNRTGYYVIVKDPRYIAMQYTGLDK